jgi:hypothetical protein
MRIKTVSIFCDVCGKEAGPLPSQDRRSHIVGRVELHMKLRMHPTEPSPIDICEDCRRAWEATFEAAAAALESAFSENRSEVK